MRDALWQQTMPKRWSRALLFPALLMLLSACGGGGGGAAPAGGGGGGTVSPFGSLAPKRSPSDEDLRYFLTRTHWGITDATYDHLVQVGLPRFVDEMLDFPPIGSTTWEQEADLLLRDDEDPPGQEGFFPSRRDLIEWFAYLMVHNPNTFQEVLAFFWHDHFATSSEVLGHGDRHWMKGHINLFREKGAGNLRRLVLDVSRDRAMLRWLDGTSSTKNAPNENFAREYLELFCLGVDNDYTQQDIVEASRAFTGYRRITIDEDTGLRDVVFDPDRHDDTDKTIFGITIPGQNLTDDYQAVVDLTFDNRNAAEWFALALLRYFCYEDPPQSIVDDVAQELRDNNYELTPVLAMLLRSEAFFSEKAKEGSVKGPVAFSVGFMKATGLYLIDRDSGLFHVRQMRDHLEDMAQLPTMPPTVNGWPAGELWLSAQGMVNRANFIQACIVDREDQGNAGFDVGELLPNGTPTSAEVVDALALRLRVTLDEADRESCIHYLDSEREGDGTVIVDPFDPSDAQDVDERVRGLLYILAQHPTYMIR